MSDELREVPRRVEGMILFEVYEANGSLLSVTSYLNSSELRPGDQVYRRVWSTGDPSRSTASALGFGRPRRDPRTCRRRNRERAAMTNVALLLAPLSVLVALAWALINWNREEPPK